MELGVTRTFIIIWILYINNGLCEDAKVVVNSITKKIQPFGKLYVANSYTVYKTSKRTLQANANKGYTVFPPVVPNANMYNVPESVYFPRDLDADDNKPRMKKVLPEFVQNSLRNKRSVADKPGELDKKPKAKSETHQPARRRRKSLSDKSKLHIVDGSNHKHKELKHSRKSASRARRNKQQKDSRREGRKGKRPMGEARKSHGKVPVVARRLISGREALIEDYPYVVSIQKSKEHWCAGALLNPRLVITTANCMWNFLPNSMSVTVDVYCKEQKTMTEKLALLQLALDNRTSPLLLYDNARIHTAEQAASRLQELGSSRISRLRVRAGSRYVDRGGQVARINEVMRHPNWSIRGGPDNDLALLSLERNIKFSDTVHGVDIPNRVMAPVFNDAWITSWGTVRRDGVYDSTFNTLQVYHASLMDRELCNNLTQRFGVGVSENFICLTQSGKRAPCTRDTGAPAVSDGVLWGLASWGIRKLCGTERFPAMFSFLASQTNMDFITNASRYLMADERFNPFHDRVP